MDHSQELLQNWERFIKIAQAPIQTNDPVTAAMVKRYAEHNIVMINDILISSIEHLRHLQKVKSMNDVICTQARLTDEIGNKLMKTAQTFFNESLNNVSDYNAWLKTHCDLATD